MKKLFIFAVISLFVFSGCKFWPFGSDVSPEAALPKDSQYVVTIDHSNREQVKNMRKFIDMLPDYGLNKKFEESMLSDEELKKNGLDYKKDILPIVDGDWKASVLLDFSKVKDGAKNAISVVAVYTAEDSKMRNFLEKQKTKAFFYANDGDIFVFAPTQVEADDGIKRLKDGTGFSTNENFKNASKNSKGNLGYIYLNQESKALKGLYIEVVADEDGFGFGGLGNLSSDKDLVAKDFPYLGDKLSLFDSVPLENPIFYIEMPDVGRYIGSFVAGFRGVVSGFDGKDYEDFISLVSNFAEISQEDAKGIFESRFAFAIGDSGETYPTVSIYFDVGEKYADSAKKIIGALDGYGDAVVKEFEAMIGLQGALKKGASVVKGGGMHKLYVDFNAVPAEMLANFSLIPGLDLKKMKIEIYYGLTGDNIFTVALYPEFDKAYGEKAVGKDKYIVEATLKNEKNPFEFMFFSPERLINFVDTNYYKIAKDYGVLNGDYESYYALAKDTMRVLKYFVSSASMFGDDKVFFDGFLKFQKVENEALEKVKEGK